MDRRTFMTATSVLAATLGLGGRVKASTAGSAHDFSFDLTNGERLELSDLRGKAVLVVNTASKCGFTKQYGPLQALHQRFQDHGLVVIGVPSSDFGSQELTTDAEISQFVSQSFSVTFPITTKTKVKDPGAHPFYQWAGQQVGFLGRPKWNFHKYLIDGDGQMVNWFSTMTSPDAPSLHSAIEAVLAKIET